VQNRELLPQYMQIRDMTRLGRKGRTKYKDLKNEDTGRYGEFASGSGRGGMGMDERFLPDRDVGKGGSGANTTHVGERRKPPVGAPDGPRARTAQPNSNFDARNDHSRSRSRSRERRRRSPPPRSYSRSRSPPPRRERYRDTRRRSYSRSPSPPQNRYRRDSRRRSYSRSRSPPPPRREDHSWRKRSPSPYREGRREKRRRMAVDV